MPFYINWCNPSDEIAPDQIGRVSVEGVDPEFITGRNVAGEVVSRFKDDSWDCRAYGLRAPFHFSSWWNESNRGPMNSLARVLTDEIKLVHWLMQNTSTASGGRSRGGAYMATLLVMLNGVAKIAYSLGISLVEAEKSDKFQVALKSSLSGSARGFRSFDRWGPFLKDLAHFSEDPDIGCRVPRLVPQESLSDVLGLVMKMVKKADSEQEQTPLIPTRILAALITNTLGQIENIEPYLPKIEAFIKSVYSDPYLMVDGRYDWKDNVKRVCRVYKDRSFPSHSEIKLECVSKDETLIRYGLREFFAEHSITSFGDLKLFITRYQTLCVILIHAFTGMRSSELQVMPYEPVAHAAAKGYGDLPVLVSHLKKFEQQNYSRALTWATSQEGVYAVRIAQQLARLNWFRNFPGDTDLPTRAPLWIPSRLSRDNPQGHYAVPMAHRLWAQGWEGISYSLGLIIERGDIDELVTFDAFRNWDEDPRFAVGRPWPLASHQFRRSVAVYASRSGMVSLPTLKTQFKHLSPIMTAFYSANSSYARSFLIDEEGKPIDNGGVLSLFREASQFNASVRFHEAVIQSSERLKGPKGTEIQLAKDRGKLPKLLFSREETEKAIKQGRLSYRDTPVGGCMHRGVCPHYGVDVVLPCTSNCADAILKENKLKDYIDNLRFEQNFMSPDSKPYKAVAAEISHVTERYLNAKKRPR
ncbi:MAG: hypothetical protein VW877_03395 [Pseudomonadaceae bacterium]|jgi:hypothetical protein